MRRLGGGRHFVSLGFIARAAGELGGGDLADIFSGIISASPGVGLIKEGVGAIVLAGTANTYDVPTNINAGTLSFRTGTADGASIIAGGTLEVTTIGNGGVASSLGASQAPAAGITFSAPTATLRYMGGAAGNTSVTTNRSFTMSNGAGGGATIESSAVGSGTLSFDNTNALGYGTINETRTLTLGGTNTGANTFGKAIGNNGSGATTLTKAGVGTWVLNQANGYAGGTNVNAGTLLVNNTTGSGTGSGTVNVAAGATLGGSGTVGGTVAVSGKVAPGQAGVSLQTLNVTGNTTLNTGASFQFNLPSTGTADKLAIGGIFEKGTGTTF